MENNQLFTRGNLSAVAAAEETKKIAEVQAKMFLARKFPRDLENAMKMIAFECQNPELAETAIYEFPRGDSVVKGASIRLVECVERYYGNIISGIEEIARTATGATVRTYAWDIETNTADEKVFDVEFIRATKKGTYPVTDPRDQYELMANQAARRKRACIQAIIPQYVIVKAMEMCQQTLNDKINKDGLEETLVKMAAAFAGLADWITADMLGAVCGKDFEKLGSRDVVKLRNLYNAIRDGFVKPEAAFGRETVPEKPSTEEQSALDRLNADLAAPAAAAEEKTAAPAVSEETPAEEVPSNADATDAG